MGITSTPPHLVCRDHFATALSAAHAVLEGLRKGLLIQAPRQEPLRRAQRKMERQGLEVLELRERQRAQREMKRRGLEAPELHSGRDAGSWGMTWKHGDMGRGSKGRAE